MIQSKIALLAPCTLAVVAMTSTAGAATLPSRDAPSSVARVDKHRPAPHHRPRPAPKPKPKPGG